MPTPRSLSSVCAVLALLAACARVPVGSYSIEVDGESYVVTQYEFVSSISLDSTTESYVEIDGQDYICFLPGTAVSDCEEIVRRYREAEAGRGDYPPTAREWVVQNALPPGEDSDDGNPPPSRETYTPPDPDPPTGGT